MTNPQDEQGPGRRASEPVAGQRISSDAPGPYQDDSAEPVVENPRLPRMDDKPEQRPSSGQTRLMDEHTAAEMTEGGRGQMAPVPSDLRVTSPADSEYPPQHPAPGLSAAAESGGYLRLLLRVDDGEMSLVDASRVAGPLSQPGPVHGGLAYAVSLGQQQLGAGDVPDPGIRRSFAPPDQPERGHALVEVPSYEFTARVPADQVSTTNLPDLQVAVYRLDSDQATQLATDQPLREQVGRVAKEVSRLRGVHIEQLPQQVRVSLERALD